MLKDTPSLLGREHSRVYRTLSTQFGDSFRPVPLVGGIFLTVNCYELILYTLVKLRISCLLNNFDIFVLGHFNFI